MGLQSVGVRVGHIIKEMLMYNHYLESNQLNQIYPQPRKAHTALRLPVAMIVGLSLQSVVLAVYLGGQGLSQVASNHGYNPLWL